MKNIWTEKDIQDGLYIIRESSPKGSENLQFARTVTYKIGYNNNDKEKPMGKCSILTDGWFCPLCKTKSEMAEYLNNDSFGYRPLTKEEFINLINSSNQGFY